MKGTSQKREKKLNVENHNFRQIPSCTTVQNVVFIISCFDQIVHVLRRVLYKFTLLSYCCTLVNELSLSLKETKLHLY